MTLEEFLGKEYYKRFCRLSEERKRIVRLRLLMLINSLRIEQGIDEIAKKANTETLSDIEQIQRRQSEILTEIEEIQRRSK
jgi:hypothetical protein